MFNMLSKLEHTEYGYLSPKEAEALLWNKVYSDLIWPYIKNAKPILRRKQTVL